MCIDEASGVDASVFVPSDTPLPHSYYDTSGQVRVVIAIMTGRKKIEQDVLAVLFGEEARKGGAEKGE